MLDEGYNGKEFTSCDTIMVFRFAKCSACIGNDVFHVILMNLG